MPGNKQGLAFKIAGLLCVAAGLIFTIAGKVPIGMMDVAVGIMLMAVANSKAAEEGTLNASHRIRPRMTRKTATDATALLKVLSGDHHERSSQWFSVGQWPLYAADDAWRHGWGGGPGRRLAAGRAAGRPNSKGGSSNRSASGAMATI